MQEVRLHKSRLDRFSEAMGKVSEALSEVEELKSELENWLDNMPENLRGGSKADELEEAISALDEVINQLQEAEGVGVLMEYRQIDLIIPA